MVFEHIEQLKREYTDKYVIVDESRPELRRFKGSTGVVKTINMNGRALVEFDAHLNIGWYDIELDYLKVIDQPLPKETPKSAKPAAKATGVAKPKKAAPAKSSGGMSASDVLAAARGQAKPAAKTGAAMNVADVLAAARGGAAAPSKPKVDPPPKSDKPADKGTKSAATDPGKMSVADVLAAARADKTHAGESTAEAQSTEAAPAAVEANPPVESAPPSGPLPTDVEGIVAWCREHDA